jgi:hypothetical protein
VAYVDARYKAMMVEILDSKKVRMRVANERQASEHPKFSSSFRDLDDTRRDRGPLIAACVERSIVHQHLSAFTVQHHLPLFAISLWQHRLILATTSYPRGLYLLTMTTSAVIKLIGTGIVRNERIRRSRKMSAGVLLTFATIFILFLLNIFQALGFVHVLTGPDHLSAIATLSASVHSSLKSFFLGVRYVE